METNDKEIIAPEFKWVATHAHHPIEAIFGGMIVGSIGGLIILIINFLYCLGYLQ